MSSFGKRADGPGGRRSAVRREVAIIGSAMTLSGSRSVFVEDLSQQAPSWWAMIFRRPERSFCCAPTTLRLWAALHGRAATIAGLSSTKHSSAAIVTSSA